MACFQWYLAPSPLKKKEKKTLVELDPLRQNLDPRMAQTRQSLRYMHTQIVDLIDVNPLLHRDA